MEKYIVRTDKELSEPMARNEAIKMVKSYADNGVEAYIVSEDEGNRLKNSEFNRPKWE
ncbi:hypothetical protein GOQ27_02125 [Clostridium sp. D2Q-11]|uniref:Uncharacterized protein n=1 Tax=Anaeromonas frigoriresistens TaxID=2683708 RepID=A0A942UX52_9FIRM|nr:hypothetical protein [Anaeromonas frigoriresistens]MBS4537237.1 hypothetical protein [Anaeromonas frigoriresistens]